MKTNGKNHMKKNLMAATLAAAAVMTSASVFADDGQINFTGEITDQGCKVSNTPTAPLNVAMGKISTGSFHGAGSTASATKFTLKLTECPSTVSTATIAFDGTSLNGNNTILALTGGTGAATGVGIQLSDDSNTVVPLFMKSKAYTLKSGSESNNLEFVARYIATADEVKPGAANATANFTIHYN